MVKIGEIPNFDAPVELVKPTPEEVIYVTRTAIGEGRRITHIESGDLGGGITKTIIATEPAGDSHPKGDVPGQDRPYRIYESLTPEDYAKLSER